MAGDFDPLKASFANTPDETAHEHPDRSDAFSPHAEKKTEALKTSHRNTAAQQTRYQQHVQAYHRARTLIKIVGGNPDSDKDLVAFMDVVNPYDKQETPNDHRFTDAQAWAGLHTHITERKTAQTQKYITNYTTNSITGHEIFLKAARTKMIAAGLAPDSTPLLKKMEQNIALNKKAPTLSMISTLNKNHRDLGQHLKLIFSPHDDTLLDIFSEDPGLHKIYAKHHAAYLENYLEYTCDKFKENGLNPDDIPQFQALLQSLQAWKDTPNTSTAHSVLKQQNAFRVQILPLLNFLMSGPDISSPQEIEQYQRTVSDCIETHETLFKSAQNSFAQKGIDTDQDVMFLEFKYNLDLSKDTPNPTKLFRLLKFTDMFYQYVTTAFSYDKKQRAAQAA